VNANPAAIGQNQIFRVQDSGEGSGDLPDLQSPLTFRTVESGGNCQNFTPLIMTPIERGTSRVRP
jgi:hypothetical protein